MSDGGRSDRQSFWVTVPGILTGIAGLVVAVTGLVALLYRPETAVPPGTAPISATSPGPGPLLAPTLISPTNESAYFVGQRSAMLTWTTVPGAAKYRVEVECRNCSKASPGSITVVWSPAGGSPAMTTTSSYLFTWTGNIDAPWRVTAFSVDGSPGPASGWWAFKYRILRIPVIVPT